jgi:AcrR family transcriptional regulator
MKRKLQQPRKRPTQARAIVTWNAILDASAQVLLAKGYERATTDRIAERAGVSIGSVYEYFPNKESIFAALTLRWNEQRWAVFQTDRVAEFEPDLEGVIRGTVRARIAATRLNPRLNTALNLEVPHHVTQDQAKTLHDEFLEVTVATLRKFENRLRSGNLELMADIAIHTTHAAVDSMAASNPELLDTREFEDEVTLLMLRYVEK